MQRHATNWAGRIALFLCLLLATGTMTAQAQNRLLLSNRADFATTGRLFQADDTLYLRVVTTDLDVTAVVENTFRITPNGDGTARTGTFTNNLDGTFTAAVPVADLAGQARTWRVEAEVEDDDGRAFAAHAVVVMRDPHTRPEHLVLRGTVEAASEAALTVGGQEVQLTAETRLILAGTAAPRPADLVGTEVVVHARREADGRLVALQVIGRAPEAPRGERHIRGRIEAVGATTLTVDGLVLQVSTETEIVGGAGQPLTFAALLPGTRVRVRAQYVDGAWLATRIQVLGTDEEDDDDEAEEAQEVKGTVEAVGEAHLVVAGVRVEVGTRTRFEGAAGLADLQAGDEVEVTFVTMPDGTHLALKVEAEREDEDDRDADALEVEGTLTAVTADSIAVDGVVFALTDTTRIVGDDGVRLTAADLTTGLEVEVRGLRQADGSAVALLIKVEDALETEVELEGLVTGKTDSTLTIGTTTFAVTAETVIEGRRRTPLTFADVQVGWHAEADLILQADGTLVARRLKVESGRQEDAVAVVGRIDSLSATEITVGGLSFGLTAATVVVGREGEEVGLAALTVGAVVKVKGHVAEEGGRVADEIEVRRFMHRNGRLAGTVTAVDEAGFAVDGTRFRVGEQTRFDTDGGLAGLQVGAQVQVHFRLLADGSRLALRVRVRRDAEAHTVLRGPLEAIRSDTLVVAGVAVRVTAATEIRDAAGAEITRADLEAGQTVHVLAETTPAGLEAVRVRVRRAVVVTGAVETRADGRLQVAGREVVVDGETLITGPHNAALSLAEVQAGAVIEVIAVAEATAGKTQGEVFVAEQIEVVQQSTQTGIDRPTADVPAAFVLEAAYPNPFNPETTIAFEVLQADAGRVSLVVYDVLGRAVATLVDGPVGQGRHRYTWRGQDDQGRTVASGLYLYRLRVGDQVATRSMVLLK